jgi:hypothetical protein
MLKMVQGVLFKVIRVVVLAVMQFHDLPTDDWLKFPVAIFQIWQGELGSGCHRSTAESWIQSEKNVRYVMMRCGRSAGRSSYGLAQVPS